MNQSLLIVDDEPPIRFALSKYFEALGCSVDTAASVEETGALIAKRCYGAAILDVRLDHRDAGLDLADVIRGRCQTTKLLMLTAYGSPEMETEARRHGVDAFLHKPMPLAEIAEVLERLLEGGGEPRA